jgi:DNA polymerase III subunit delta
VTIIKEDQFQSFLAKSVARTNGILIYGSDSSAAMEYAGQLAKAVEGTGSSEAVLRLESSALKSDPARLSDEFRSLSLLGDRKAIVVDECDDGTLEVLTDVLTTSFIGNFVVLTAGSLNKSSKLRAAAEQAKLFACLPLYEAKAEAIAGKVEALVRQYGLRMDAEALDTFLSLIGENRSLALREAEKLATYCQGQQNISAADVEAVCGDVSEFVDDQLIDAVLGGDLDSADRISQAYEAEGSSARPILTLLMSHVSRLQNLKLDVARGMTIDAAVSSAKPIVFFGRRRAMAEQMKRFDLDALESIQASLHEALFNSRKTAALSSAIINRAVLAVTRHARAVRTAG